MPAAESPRRTPLQANPALVLPTHQSAGAAFHDPALPASSSPSTPVLPAVSGLRCCRYSLKGQLQTAGYSGSPVVKRSDHWPLSDTPACLLYTSPSPRDGLLSR